MTIYYSQMKIVDFLRLILHFSRSTNATDEAITFGRWSIRDIHDPKFNEEKLAIQFRAGRLGYFGLAVNWYANLPFQTWELKPDNKKYAFFMGFFV